MACAVASLALQIPGRPLYRRPGMRRSKFASCEESPWAFCYAVSISAIYDANAGFQVHYNGSQTENLNSHRAQVAVTVLEPSWY
jgi:hypothetical protein